MIRGLNSNLRRLGSLTTLALGLISPTLVFAESPVIAEDRFEEQILPILEDHCFACHGLGASKGGVAFDKFEPAEARVQDQLLWLAVLKNVRAGVMPPADKPRLAPDELSKLEQWIKYEAFGIDPDHLDPGRVVIRRLNRVEYRNTIRDLLNVDFDAPSEFPSDDSGHGFDNIGEVLTISPLLLEKYLDAARSIINDAVPKTSGAPATERIAGSRFRPANSEPASKDVGRRPLALPYKDAARVAATYHAPHDGRYRLKLDLVASERYVDGVFDLNRCRTIFRIDDKEVYRQEFSRQENKRFQPSFEVDWKSGEHHLSLEVEPLTPDLEPVRSLTLRLDGVNVIGPLEREHWVRPEGYLRFFPEETPKDPTGRREAARLILERFATRAFRLPVDSVTLGRLVDLSEKIADAPGGTFEIGVGEAMTAILASPRFLFREEGYLDEPDARYPKIDEYSLASRLSYFLWSTTPDDELYQLAAEGRLRQNQESQVRRMLADPRASSLTHQFVGQWLQARDIEGVPINAFAVATRDEPPDPDAEQRRQRFRELRQKEPGELTEAEKAEFEEIRKRFTGSRQRFQDLELTGELRRAMRQETELLFEHILREDRSLLELLDTNYTFLNERLAKYYGISGVEGPAMRRVELAPDSPRGGVLTQGTYLAVTSNPDRTSPVKRGLFILENLLGTPPPPPPPDIPALEDSEKRRDGKFPTLRESLAIHRQMPACASCHDRMDPLGLAFENFNALGRWREQERGGPIDASGTLITGESFSSVKELKRILVTERRGDFYRCLTEKLLTYALGRGLDANDVQTVDDLVERLEREGGRASVLLSGILESDLFQRRRRPEPAPAAVSINTHPNQFAEPSGPAKESQP